MNTNELHSYPAVTGNNYDEAKYRQWLNQVEEAATAVLTDIGVDDSDDSDDFLEENSEAIYERLADNGEVFTFFVHTPLALLSVN